MTLRAKVATQEKSLGEAAKRLEAFEVGKLHGVGGGFGCPYIYARVFVRRIHNTHTHTHNPHQMPNENNPTPPPPQQKTQAATVVRAVTPAELKLCQDVVRSFLHAHHPG